MTYPTLGNGPVPVALALLDRQWPANPPLADAVGASTDEASLVVALESDPRYLIGRFQQALAELLANDLPQMDDMTSLLSDALADAIAWRHHDDRPCVHCPGSLCEECNADWDQADRYHALARALGAVGDPTASPRPVSARSSSGAGRFHPGSYGRKEAKGDPHDVTVVRTGGMARAARPKAGGEAKWG
jgi:hypothetical protein